MDSSQQRMLIYQLVQMQPLNLVYGRFPTTDVVLLLILIKTSENSLRILPNNGCQSTDLFRFLSRLLKTVHGFIPTTDVNLSTCSDATFEFSLRTLPNNGCCSIADSTSILLKTVHGFSSNEC